jgi:leucyl aminopeptidase (aminopeptidase T)
MPMPDRNQLARYADGATRVGIGLAAGDRLMIVSSIDATAFTRVLVEQAYPIISGFEWGFQT